MKGKGVTVFEKITNYKRTLWGRGVEEFSELRNLETFPNEDSSEDELVSLTNDEINLIAQVADTLA